MRTGDKVKVLRGQFKGKTGTVDRVDINKERIYVSGVETVKKEGGK
ncbi:MAG: KOW motif-containing protein, partial [Simkania sp.]|nr:KOW motif-containing protein [Simkania sp.]